jgi:hypothetical protein
MFPVCIFRPRKSRLRSSFFKESEFGYPAQREPEPPEDPPDEPPF